MGCFEKLTGGFAQDCDKPIKSGLRSKGLILNVEDIDHWVTSGSANQFLPVLKAGKVAFPIDVLGSVPFTGTNVASAVDDFQRSFTKTVVFNIPVSGSAAALKVEQLTKSQWGFVIMVEGKDAGGDLNGTFMIFGKDEPLLCTVAKDYVAGVSAPIITATSIEKGYENFLFMTDLATTKTAFDVLYDADLTKRLYFLEAVEDGDDLNIVSTLVFGTAPADPGLYNLVVVSTVGATTTSTPAATADMPTIPHLSGASQILNVVTDGAADNSVVHAVMVEILAETAGTPIYFAVSYYKNVGAIATIL